LRVKLVLREDEQARGEREAMQLRWLRSAVPRWLARPPVCLLLALLATSSRAFATDVTLIADAHVNTARPSINSGSLSNINVGGGYTGLLQFDLSTLPAATTAAQVSRAVLRLYCNRVITPGLISIQPVTAAWSESTVTFATLPPLNGTVQVFTAAQPSTFISIDVTSMVQGWTATPSTNFGLALSAGTAAVQFDSKENDQTAHPAQLDLSLASSGPAGVAGPAGPAGTGGATGSRGAAGTAGLAGAAGAAGATGLTGETGPQGPSGAGGFVYEGTYSSVQNYAVGQIVTWAGASYISLQNSNHGNPPSSTPLQWGVLSAQGNPGVGGPAGIPGPARNP
jgi:hypothetical protein